jgi:hypothetical protein
VRQIHERPIVIRPSATRDWLFAALGLDRYPIRRRRYEGKVVEFTPEATLEYTERMESRQRKR